MLIRGALRCSPMSQEHGPYHRLGEPGGPGAEVTALAIEGVRPDGEHESAQLLAAADGSTEVELLRTVCAGLGVTWGEDEFGWWAAVPSRLLG